MNLDHEDMPSPGLKPVFTLDQQFGETIDLGRLATGGLRSMRMVTGGTIAGEQLNGHILSGSETYLTRKDQVTTIETVYVMRSDDDVIIRVIGTGNSSAKNDFDGIRLTLVFEVDEASPRAWLATRAFVAERKRDSASLSIVQIV
ncbi:DUF3237 family protein [Altericroceibacterium endophyticum]|uniref:DUF3237 family protein n=1 Tax=Altericroceibacterium endophyticum TaxID=1808508 RepID=A0A6I4T7J9_9SPHN|nr:DUF3237 family protein [Altericroceibacterium endophyticum]MXO66439.1 DUF3237 family protein [Altericroceibacterium endophyticum]